MKKRSRIWKGTEGTGGVGGAEHKGGDDANAILVYKTLKKIKLNKNNQDELFQLCKQDQASQLCESTSTPQSC